MPACLQASLQLAERVPTQQCPHAFTPCISSPACCSINCMHILPDLAYVEKKYAGTPFAVVSHTFLGTCKAFWSQWLFSMFGEEVCWDAVCSGERACCRNTFRPTSAGCLNPGERIHLAAQPLPALAWVALTPPALLCLSAALLPHPTVPSLPGGRAQRQV